MIEPKATDTVFTDSPDAGEPECICSRCLKPIPYQQVPTRCWPEEGELGFQNTVGGTEYRYCYSCLRESGITILDDEPDHEGPMDDPQAWAGGFADNH